MTIRENLSCNNIFIIYQAKSEISLTSELK